MNQSQGRAVNREASKRCTQCQSTILDGLSSCSKCASKSAHRAKDLTLARKRIAWTHLDQTGKHAARKPNQGSSSRSVAETLVSHNGIHPGSVIGCKAGTAKLSTGKPLSVLLATAGAGGTIAAVRHLRARGVGVAVVTSQKLAAAAWSNTGVHKYSAPPEGEAESFIERLMAIGKANPGQILLPTSDQTVWLYTLHAERLRKYFRLYQPSIESIQTILNKKLFEAAVRKAGLTALPSWEPRTMEEMAALSPTLPYPILIKPRTHIHRVRNNKGIVVHSKAELLEQYPQFISREHFRDKDKGLLPDASLPILQQFVGAAKEGVCSVSGFLDRSGELFVTRRSTKVLQRSQPVGVGVCFESLPNDPDLSDAVRRLCREMNYFGMFEVEFLPFEGGWAAIDFNARLFNQVGMDILGGMPLPLFACLDAAGEVGLLREAVVKAQTAKYKPAAFCDGFTLRATLLARTLTGRLSSEESAHWRAWQQKHAGHTVDFAADQNDPLPGFVHALSDLCLGLKAIPRFLQSIPKTVAVNTFVAVKAHR